MSTNTMCRDLAPGLATVIRTAGVVALLGAAGGCTSTDRYDVPRPASSAPAMAPAAGPAATTPQGVGSGNVNAPYYQGSNPDLPRGTRGRGKAP